MVDHQAGLARLRVRDANPRSDPDRRRSALQVRLPADPFRAGLPEPGCTDRSARRSRKLRRLVTVISVHADVEPDEAERVVRGGLVSLPCRGARRRPGADTSSDRRAWRGTEAAALARHGIGAAPLAAGSSGTANAGAGHRRVACAGRDALGQQQVGIEHLARVADAHIPASARSHGPAGCEGSSGRPQGSAASQSRQAPACCWSYVAAPVARALATPSQRNRPTRDV